jgi:O-acetyl-ADP-ribose deacetylase (regulator of RNase III)
MDEKPRECFVIMPFGEKKDADGKTIDFDKFYDECIYDAITGEPMRKAKGPPLECIRCDKIAQAGWVHHQMISHIYDAEVAVVDLSTLNPNVFYELGVRHALRRTVTVLLCREGTKIPFNIGGFKTIKYNYPSSKQRREKLREDIASFVANGINTGERDSLVYEVLEAHDWEGAPAKSLPWEPPRSFRLRNFPDAYIHILAGGGFDPVKGIDIWVNSENTNMEMARLFDRATSAAIRYLGAQKEAGDVKLDIIAQELNKQMKGRLSVPPGTILVTGPGELKEKGVKWIFHVAAVQGQPGKGYKPIEDISDCIRTALELANSAKYRRSKCSSILFPLLGTGTAGANVHKTAGSLIDAAVKYFDQEPISTIRDIYFLAMSDRARNACLSALNRAKVDRVEQREAPVQVSRTARSNASQAKRPRAVPRRATVP